MNQTCKELPPDQVDLARYCGTYLEGWIKRDLIDRKLHFTRFNETRQIELYPISEGQFTLRWSDHSTPYVIDFDDNGRPAFLGYRRPY